MILPFISVYPFYDQSSEHWQETFAALILYVKFPNLSTGRISQNPPPNYAFGDQEPFREKVPGLPKAFYYQKFLEVSAGAGSPDLLVGPGLSGQGIILSMIHHKKYMTQPDMITPQVI